MANQVRVEIQGNGEGLLAEFAKVLKAGQGFFGGMKTGAQETTAESAKLTAQIEAQQAQVQKLTNEWLKLKGAQLGGDNSKILQNDLKATSGALGKATADLKRMQQAQEGLGGGAPASAMEAGIGRLKSLAINAIGGYIAFESLKRGVEESIRGTVEWVVSSQKLGLALGLTTEKASALKIAIDDVHATEEQFEGALSKVTRSLNAHEDAFHQLGVETRDGNGHLRSTTDILLDTNTALANLKAGTDRNVAAAAIFGKGWLENQRVMQLTRDRLQEAEEKGRRLGLLVGGDLVEATNRFRDAQQDAGDVLQAMKIRVGKELLPVLTDFNEWAAKDGPSALGVLGNSVKVVITIWKTLVFIIQTVGAVAGAVIGQIVNNVTGLGTVAARLLSGDLKGAVQAGKDWIRDTKANFSAAGDEIKDRWQNLGMDLNKIWDENLRKRASTAPGGGEGQGDTFKKDKGESEFQRLQAEFEREKFLYEKDAIDKGQARKYTTEMEAAYWQKAINQTEAGSKERFEVEQKYYQAQSKVNDEAHAAEIARLDTQLEEAKGNSAQRILIAQKELDEQKAYYGEHSKEAEAAAKKLATIEYEAAQEQKKIQELKEEQARNHQVAMLGLQEEMLHRAAALGEISATQEIRGLITLEQKRFEISKDALEARLKLAEKEPAERQRILGEIEALEDQFAAKTATLNLQLQNEALKTDGWAGWASGIREYVTQAQNTFANFKNAATSIATGVQQAFSTALSAMLQGQMSFSQGMKAIWKGIVQAVVQAIAQLIAQWITAAIMQRVLGKKQNEASGSKVAASLSAATAETWEAYAGIPGLGPVLALAQTALMFSSFGASATLATAAGAKVKAMAVGSRVDEPTLSLIGEAGPEIVAPERSFLDYTRGILSMGANLVSNVTRRQAAAAAYDYEAGSVAGAAAGLRGAPLGGGMGGDTHFHMSLAGATFLDGSRKGMQDFGNHVLDSIVATARARGVVIKPGQITGGI